ncbi:MAG: amidohydrolase [SAR202 cluster bacterium]|nr:amidohydrolase [SAR202 cluster bacterium]
MHSDTATIKKTVAAEIDRHADALIGVARDILAHPEPGFREVRTAKLTADWLRRLGLAPREGIGITGVKAVAKGGGDGPTVAVMGELDSMIVLGHTHADPVTNAAHACGHHVQIAMMLGVAAGLRAAGVLEKLSGKVAFMAVPAEEFIEIEYRDELRREGKLEFLGGKAEFIRLGHLDDVDMAMMTHAIGPVRDSLGTGVTDAGKPAMLAVGGTNNGMIAKKIQFTGRAAHAGGAPHKGVNALNAAMLAIAAIHAQRETFRDEDTIRVHPIITRGGAAVSSVPADVRMETFVRGRTVEAFMSANEKVDRALRAGALAVGASVTITNLPGYLPIANDPAFTDVYRANAAALVGEDRVATLGHRTGSTDMGDVSHLMPVIHPYAACATGVPHGADFVVQDYTLGVVTGAKAMALTVVDLLADGANLARRITSAYKPPMDKAEYLAFLRALMKEETYTE